MSRSLALQGGLSISRRASELLEQYEAMRVLGIESQRAQAGVTGWGAIVAHGMQVWMETGLTAPSSHCPSASSGPLGAHRPSAPSTGELTSLLATMMLQHHSQEMTP